MAAVLSGDVPAPTHPRIRDCAEIPWSDKRHMRAAVLTTTLLSLAAPSFAADDPFDSLNLEAHGFVSFGHLKSWGNNWLGETLDGTGEFWEAAGNVIARPMDHLRLGAQLFVRDLGAYANGRVELDWAYADWRVNDAFGLQVGRVKMPFGLFCESLDIDAGRTSVFLPQMYPTRAREILLSTDGAKLYGTLGPVDWAFYGGQRQLQDDGDFASYFAYRFSLDSVQSIEADSVFGGMLHWYTPLDGLATRISLARLDDLDLSGTSAGGAATVDLHIPYWWAGMFSLIYERGPFTICAEYQRYYAQNDLEITSGLGTAQEHETTRTDAAYLSCTWHWRPWLSFYGSIEGAWNDPAHRHDDDYQQSLVGAVCLQPLDHWAIKAEFRYNHGTFGVDPQLNPDGLDDEWQVLALKTTLDF
jgi:hypothetical protein